ncbi:PREDICTED: uncharacterized protein LOC105315825, partial [Amphimedon queenslandica]|uniref:DDE-1 domain-containing protein n=2 Tax=Amphimedon queenslandica TaxID=400682 RepID=A0AAN0ISH8_AMPQE
TEINKQVDVLTAIRWIKHSWEQVKESTIQHCFRHCGFHYVPVPVGDPFSDLDEDDDTAVLNEMIHELQPDGMSAIDYVSAEEDVPTSQSFEDNDNWREELRRMVIDDTETDPKASCLVEEIDSEEEDSDTPELAISSLQEAIKVANDLMLYLTDKGHEDLSDKMYTVINSLQRIKISESRQTSIINYFT